MSAAVAWSNVLEAAQVPEGARTKLQELGYITQESMEFKDEATFEAFAKYFVLEVYKPDGVKAETWAFHPLVGTLRALWKKTVAPAQAANAPCQALAVPAVTGCGLAGALVGQGKSVTVIQRDEMRRELEKKCSGTLITLATLPAMSLLSQIKSQFDSQAWDWIPWKKLLSEKMATAMKGRRKSGPHESFMEALACGTGFYEEQYDKEVSGAPFHVQTLLQVRAHAYAMVNACHLGSWALYNTRFMEYYTRECGEHFRFLTAAEAEEADQLAMREVFGLCYGGASLNDALSTVAIDRDMLRHLLMPRPKASKPATDKEPLKRRVRKAQDEDMNGECFMWRKGKCHRKNCKFNHFCALCNSPDHAAADCPEAGQAAKRRKPH